MTPQVAFTDQLLTPYPEGNWYTKHSRPFPDFVSSILNPQKFAQVGISKRELDRESASWFYQNCVRRPNQFTGKIRVGAPITSLADGIKGGGKSALIGSLEAFYKKTIGGYGSKDDEVLTSLRAIEYKDKVPPKIGENISHWERGLIIGSPAVSITSSWDYVSWDRLTLNDIERHDVIVCPNRLHPTAKSFFMCMERLTDILWTREEEEPAWFFKILEAANIIYARITMKRARIDAAKAHLIYLMREMRHVGMALGMDSQYMLSLDREVRVNADYTFLKNMGSDQIPRDIRWMYGWFTPWGLMALNPNEWVCKDKWGGLYMGTFKLPPWSRKPKERLYDAMDIKRDVGDAEDIAPETDDEDITVHDEIVTEWLREQTIKGTVRKLTLAGTPHDRDTVRRHVLKHKERKCHHYLGGGSI